jgi:hypothetical protein
MFIELRHAIIYDTLFSDISEDVSPLSLLTSTPKIEVIRSSKMSVSSYEAAKWHNPEDHNPHFYSAKTLTFYNADER